MSTRDMISKNQKTACWAATQEFQCCLIHQRVAQLSARHLRPSFLSEKHRQLYVRLWVYDMVACIGARPTAVGSGESTSESHCHADKKGRLVACEKPRLDVKPVPEATSAPNRGARGPVSQENAVSGWTIDVGLGHRVAAG